MTREALMPLNLNRPEDYPQWIKSSIDVHQERDVLHLTKSCVTICPGATALRLYKSLAKNIRLLRLCRQRNGAYQTNFLTSLRSGWNSEEKNSRVSRFNLFHIYSFISPHTFDLRTCDCGRRAINVACATSSYILRIRNELRFRS